MLVELAVLRRPDGCVLVRERLVAFLDVHDTQAPDADGYAGCDERAHVVRTPVTMTSVMRSSAYGAMTSPGSPSNWMTPQIPHTHITIWTRKRGGTAPQRTTVASLADRPYHLIGNHADEWAER